MTRAQLEAAAAALLMLALFYGTALLGVGPSGG